MFNLCLFLRVCYHRFASLRLKALCKNSGQWLPFQIEVGTVPATSLTEYVVVVVVEVDAAADTDDLVAGVTAAVVVGVAFANIIFDDYIACVAVDVVAVDAGVPAVAHVDA